MNSFIHLGTTFTPDGNMRERSEETYWNCEDSIHIYDESTVREKHPYAGSTESTEIAIFGQFCYTEIKHGH